MKYRVVLFCTFFALAFFSASAQEIGGRPNRDNHDSSIMSTVTGNVLSTDGHAVNDATVEVRNAMTGEVVKSGYTLPNGTFEFDNVPSGRYEIVARSGLQEVRQQVQIDSSLTQLTLRMATTAEGAGSAGGDTVTVAEMKISDKARKAVQKAEEAFKKQKLDQARRETEKALQIAPGYARALTLLGILDLNENQAPKAQQEVEAAVKSDSNYGLAYVVLGAIYNVAGRFDDALRTLREGIARVPNSWQAYFESSKADLGKGQFAEALRNANKAAQFASADYPPIHLVRAHALLGLKDYTQAVSELEHYLGGEPNGADSAQARRTLDQVRAYMASNHK